MNISLLKQVGSIIIFSDSDTQDMASSDTSGDPRFGLKDSYLSDYLRDGNEIAALGAGLLSDSEPSSDTSSESPSGSPSDDRHTNCSRCNASQ